jgi:hypothetical protein
MLLHKYECECECASESRNPNIAEITIFGDTSTQSSPPLPEKNASTGNEI